MKNKKWIFNLVYAIILIGYAIVGLGYAEKIKSQGAILIGIILYMILGVLLGVSKFYSEMKKQGKWIINLPRLLFIGIPSLILATYQLGFFMALIPIPLNFNPTIFQIIFGYILISSFGKDKNPL